MKRTSSIGFATVVTLLGASACTSILGTFDYQGAGGSSSASSTSSGSSTSGTTSSGTAGSGTAGSTSTTSSATTTSTSTTSSSGGTDALGATCITGTDCASGFCANGVCCTEACTGTCQACNLALTGEPSGTCTSQMAGTAAPSGQCTASPPCGNDGMCGASGVCEQGASGTECGTTCLNGQLTINQCNGAGSCTAATASMCAGKLAACATPTACATMCTGDSDCSTGYWCDTSTGACNQQGTPASAAKCSANNQCTNGICVDGYCCNTTCTDTCSSCAVTSLEGICTLEPDNDTNPNHACTSGSTCCSDACTPVDTVAHCGTCGNACPATGTLCQTPACQGGSCMPTNASMGTMCSDNGGSVCNATGTCVECNQASDCKGLSVPGCCNSKCVDLSADGNNCASCGHGCLGGGCANSLCEPVTLATFETCVSSGTAGTGIAVDATNVYWAESNCSDMGAVHQVPIAGGTAITLSTLYSPGGVAVNATMTYFTDSYSGKGYVVSCAIGGCGAIPPTLSSSETSPFGIALDATHVYWVDQESSPNGSLRYCNLSGCTPTTLVTGYKSPAAVVTDANNVYWGDSSGVYKTPLVGKSGSGTPTTLESSQAATFNLAVDSTFVYYYTDTIGINSGAVAKVPIAGGAVTPLATGFGQFGGFVAVDSTSLYWTDETNVRRCTLPSCTNVVVLGTAANAGAIAVDNTAIYVVSSGKLLKYAK